MGAAFVGCHNVTDDITGIGGVRRSGDAVNGYDTGSLEDGP